MPTTLTNIANFYGDLGTIMRAFNPKCELLMNGLGTSIKYGVYDCTERENPYLLIASQAIIPDPRVSYNFILTVATNSLDKSLGVRELFAKVTEIPLREASEELQKLMSFAQNQAFEVFMKYGPSVMEILKRRPL